MPDGCRLRGGDERWGDRFPRACLIARSDDYLRAFHHLRYDVRQPVKWQRLAFYQLGADYYNDTPARSVAIGSLIGLREEWQPIRAKEVYERRGVALAGEQPWISIHGIDRAAVNQGGAVASRGLIVRSWKAVLGGKPCPQPHASFFATEYGKGNFRTVVELSPPPDLPALQRGDFVEADIELVVSRLTRRLTTARTRRSGEPWTQMPIRGGWCSARQPGMPSRSLAERER